MMKNKKYNGYTVGRYGGLDPEVNEMAELAREQDNSVLAKLIENDKKSLINVTAKVINENRVKFCISHEIILCCDVYKLEWLLCHDGKSYLGFREMNYFNDQGHPYDFWHWFSCNGKKYYDCLVSDIKNIKELEGKEIPSWDFVLE